MSQTEPDREAKEQWTETTGGKPRTPQKVARLKSYRLGMNYDEQFHRESPLISRVLGA